MVKSFLIELEIYHNIKTDTKLCARATWDLYPRMYGIIIPAVYYEHIYV